MRIAVGSDHAGFHLIVRAFLRTEFEGGRHARRIGQIAALESEPTATVAGP